MVGMPRNYSVFQGAAPCSIMLIMATIMLTMLIIMLIIMLVMLIIALY